MLRLHQENLEYTENPDFPEKQPKEMAILIQHTVLILPFEYFAKVDTGIAELTGF